MYFAILELLFASTRFSGYNAIDSFKVRLESVQMCEIITSVSINSDGLNQ